nr:ribonuclease H-like domain-containing protein [Tanacetum cinerariifolium]
MTIPMLLVRKESNTRPLVRPRQIKREYSNAKTPQQNEVAKRKNKTLIEAVRTMLVDSFLPITFWAEAVNTACYVLNRILVTKPQNKIPYELLTRDKIEKNTDFKTYEKPVSQGEQIFLKELKKLKRQEIEANDAAESLRNEATHDIQNANTSSFNQLNTVSTPLSTVGPSRAFNDGELSYPDDPSMPHHKDIYASPSKGIFTDSSYDDEAVQTRSKVNKNSKAHALGNMQDKVIDYDEVFAPVTRIEAIRIFLAISSYMGFIVYQMGVNIAFLYGTINEEVYDWIFNVFTASRLDIMLAVYAYSRFQVTPKTLHLQAMKRIFRYLKGQPKLGLWYPKVSLFGLEAYSNGDYASVNLDKKSITGGGHTSDLAEGSLNLEALFALCTNLSNRVLALVTIKDAQAKVILTLKARLKKLEKRCKPSISHHRAWLKSVSLLSKKKNLYEDMDTEEALNKGRQSTDDTARPDVSTARQELSTAGLATTPTTSTIFDDKEMTLADTLIKLKDDKAKVLLSKIQNKGKGILEEIESAKKMTKSDFDAAQIARDEEIARQLEVELQAEIERERQREEQASMGYIANLYDEVQVRIDADHELALRWTHKEYEKYTVDERAKLMMTYLKNIGRFTYSQLNKKSFKDIQGLYMKEHELIIDFVPIGSEEDERMIKDMNKEAEEESSDKDGAEGIYYRIFRSDRSSRWIKTFFEMVIRFDRLDLVELYNLVMQRFESTTPEGVDLILWEDLRIIVHILILEDGIEIHMLAEKRYPLTTRTVKRILSLRLIVESASDGAYDLLRFIQKQIDESGGHDRGVKDL